MPTLSPKPKTVTVGGKSFTLVAFYFPGYNSSCDTKYNAACFGNFWPCSVSMTINGISETFHTAEAAFQALKWWSHDADRKALAACISGNDAFRMKRKLEKGPHSPDPTYAGLAHTAYDGRGGMDVVLAAKFADPALKAALLATGDAYLLEHNDTVGRDAHWSDNHDGTGTNWLGQSLMNLRAKLGGTGNPASSTEEYQSEARGGKPVSINQFTAHV